VSSQVDTSVTTASPPQEQQPGLAGLLSDWFAAYGERMALVTRLVLAEARLAVSSFVLMMFLVMLAAGALMFAWGLVLFAAVRAFEMAGMSLIAGGVLMALLHLALALFFWHSAGRLGKRLDFAATRRVLGSEP
jgi:hypothetical protein